MSWEIFFFLCNLGTCHPTYPTYLKATHHRRDHQQYRLYGFADHLWSCAAVPYASAFLSPHRATGERPAREEGLPPPLLMLMMLGAASQWILAAAAAAAVAALLWLAVSTLEWAWWTPRRLERALRAQGIRGNRYRLFTGDVPENVRLNREARKKPLPLGCHDIIPRVLPMFSKAVEEHGIVLSLQRISSFNTKQY